MNRYECREQDADQERTKFGVLMNRNTAIISPVNEKENRLARARKQYSRYYIVRGNQALWKGDPDEDGSGFRQFLITSNEFFSTAGAFQVYGLEGTGKGIKDGKLATSDEEPKLLFDDDFNGLEAASKKFTQLVTQARKEGFREMSFIELLEFESKLQGSH